MFSPSLMKHRNTLPSVLWDGASLKEGGMLKGLPQDRDNLLHRPSFVNWFERDEVMLYDDDDKDDVDEGGRE